LRAAEFSFTFIVKPNQLNNLNLDSVALVFQLRAVDKKRLKNKLGSLDHTDIEILYQKIKEIMKL